MVELEILAYRALLKALAMQFSISASYCVMNCISERTNTHCKHNHS